MSSPLLRDVERRIAEWSHIPVEHGENLYLLKYDVGQKYIPHHDFFGGTPCSRDTCAAREAC